MSLGQEARVAGGGRDGDELREVTGDRSCRVLNVFAIKQLEGEAESSR